jgi:membrane-bound serine protease (ClpP class)
LGVVVVLWIKFFPRSPIGRSMTLSEDGRTFKSSDSHAGLVGKDGVAQSELRPAGFALIDGKRIDVITEGSLVPRGTPIQVVRVEGNRVIVRKQGS